MKSPRKRAFFLAHNAEDFQVTPEQMDEIDHADFTAIVSAGTVFAAEPSRSATLVVFEHDQRLFAKTMIAALQPSSICR